VHTEFTDGREPLRNWKPHSLANIRNCFVQILAQICPAYLSASMGDEVDNAERGIGPHIQDFRVVLLAAKCAAPSVEDVKIRSRIVLQVGHRNWLISL